MLSAIWKLILMLNGVSYERDKAPPRAHDAESPRPDDTPRVIDWNAPAADARANEPAPAQSDDAHPRA